eukprot:scaffold67524_cov31-Tisochrysis_lutea.AAC.2
MDSRVARPRSGPRPLCRRRLCRWRRAAPQVAARLPSYWVRVWARRSRAADSNSSCFAPTSDRTLGPRERRSAGRVARGVPLR